MGLCYFGTFLVNEMSNVTLFIESNDAAQSVSGTTPGSGEKPNSFWNSAVHLGTTVVSLSISVVPASSLLYSPL